MPLIDAEQRSQATDPARSFIVQAPAGSGKTEILTQRFLRLLSCVSMPEQIIALTFTRKAASEMRERIILALQQAASNHEPQTAHQQMTLEFAKQALKRSEQYQWNLLQQSNRLKICTLDALCQSINQSIPLLEKHFAFSEISNMPASDYLNAARVCIQFALKTPTYQQAMITLLAHMDNRQDHLLNLFTGLLSQRDQWISLIFQARGKDKSYFESAMAVLEQEALSTFKRCLPHHLAKQLIELARELATIENTLDSPRYILRNWYELDQINTGLVKALAKLILTGEENFRTSFDHHVGLKRGVCTNADYSKLKADSKELLAHLGAYPEFHQALIQIIHLPETEYEDRQWDVLQALFIVLPLLLSHLQVHFSEKNKADFTTFSQQAVMALGDFDNPTDLALYLDAALHHILVDEFQDTSIQQFEFISKLVQGWQPEEGKTLFIVGDPMQSIYRFRQAEVGLFFRAQEQGIGLVALNSLQLQCNFRSTEILVNWVNKHFLKIFPEKSNIETGAVSFHPSTAVINIKDDSQVFAQKFKNKKQEAEHLIQAVIFELQRNTTQSLAILVRSRTHLPEIIRLLRQHDIPYQGNEIDLLANLNHIRDVYSLTQALLSPANRLYWLAVIRSPYCGLSLSDTLSLATFDKKKSIMHALLQLDNIQGISEDGRHRAGFFIQVMQEALALRYQYRLSDWVAQTLKRLHIDKILEMQSLDDLEQFWGLLDCYEQDGRIPALDEFLEHFNRLYSQQVKPSRLQVMTIHKSKGLEFDTVFLPCLGSQPKRADTPILRWHTVSVPHQDNLLLVSPIQAAEKERCALYDYLGRLDEARGCFELQRLLYVAVTRAKSRLYLMDSASKSSKQSILHLLKSQEFTNIDEDLGQAEHMHTLPQLQILPSSYYVSFQQATLSQSRPSSFALYSSIPRLTGVVGHRLLQWICENHPKTPAQIPWGFVEAEFKKLGFNFDEQQQAIRTIQNQIALLFNSPRGSWIIKQHKQEQTEYALLVEHQGEMVTRILDRIFIENDIVWIIDFKTGKQDADAIKEHQEQLNEYKTHVSAFFSLPIRCGLYYLVNGHWLEW
ncbi:MAG: UvrD-helicase domain-containing protein [Legionella sp.]|nr:UvrD-helicase domain-containing protein [Legionella sp.]